MSNIFLALIRSRLSLDFLFQGRLTIQSIYLFILSYSGKKVGEFVNFLSCSNLICTLDFKSSGIVDLVILSERISISLKPVSGIIKVYQVKKLEQVILMKLSNYLSFLSV